MPFDIFNNTHIYSLTPQYIVVISASIVVCIKKPSGARLLVSANVGDSDSMLLSGQNTWRRLSDVCYFEEGGVLL